MIVKVFLTLDLDEDEYPMPSDEDVADELVQGFQDFVFDIDGIKIKTIRITTEKKHE